MPINKSPNPQILDKVIGCLVGAACADALGAPFEFGPPLANNVEIEMVGGGFFNWVPGQFTDDTEMAIPIANLLFAGDKKGAYTTLDKLVEDWFIWAKSAKDVGVQTRSVLNSLTILTEAEANAKAERYHFAHQERSGGNGGLMRAFPIPLAYPEDVDGLIDMVRRTVQLTHWERDAYEAAIIWTLAIRTSYFQNKLEVRDQLLYLPESSRSAWDQRIDTAERELPAYFTNSNGWVVSAFQAAWSAIYHSDNYIDAVSMAIRAGGDTDTVACITGALAGAYYGYSSIPERWRTPLNGSSGFTLRDLVELASASQAAQWAGAAPGEWPDTDFVSPTQSKVFVRHPTDVGLYLGNLAAIDTEEIEEVVALCRVGRKQTDASIHEFWLIDQPAVNTNLPFIVQDCVETIMRLREKGKNVLLLCHGAHSRTPFIAAAYSMLALGESRKVAIESVTRVLPYVYMQPEFERFLINLESL